jgi:pimeloyl-ACP methyl ester carboxylesterase
VTLTPLSIQLGSWEVKAGRTGKMGDIYLQKWGQAGQAALLLHPALASSDMWRSLAENLTDLLAMVAVDFPGHGRSADWDCMGDYHGACSEIAAAQLSKPMHIIGHSFGATVALRIALEHPEMVHSLTLIEPVLFAAAKGTKAYFQHEVEFQPFITAMQAGDRQRATQVFTKLWGTGAAWDNFPAATKAYLSARIDLIPASSPAINDDNAGLLNTGRLESLNCPVLLLKGEKSPVIINAIHSALAARLPNVQRVQVDGAGHMLPMTHVKIVSGIIRNFISAITSD